MKKYTHAWLALKAVEMLKRSDGRFGSDERNKRLKKLLAFISAHPSTFVRGAWFPDSVVKDNVMGGHTWKYYLDPSDGRRERRRPPTHNTCLRFVTSDLDKMVSLDLSMSDLPDRCEALCQTIRDTILITNKVSSGDVVAFNDSQTALFFLMLSHYVCDAHVPVHCDKRDFYTPSKVHPDLEAFWEREIKKYYRVSTKTNQFDLDEDMILQRNISRLGYEESILCRCEEILDETDWENMNAGGDDWRIFLGGGNKNFWDYIVSVCLVSFHMSLRMFPINPPDNIDYDTVRIMDVPQFKRAVLDYSPYILADAINSVAVLWLASWERWELLRKGTW